MGGNSGSECISSLHLYFRWSSCSSPDGTWNHMLGRGSGSTPSVPCSSVVGRQTRTEVGQCIAGSKLIRVQCVGLGRAAAPSKGSFHLAASSQSCEMPFDPALQSSS